LGHKQKGRKETLQQEEALQEVPIIESSQLSTKMGEATKKNSWVDKDLTKSPKKKCFQENRAILNAKKNTTTNTWVQEDLSKFPQTRRH